VVALNKADLYDAAHADPDLPAPVLGDVVPVSAVTGYGLDMLRLSLSSAIAALWEHIDVTLPYVEGELLARVRERGTVEVDYRNTDVHITGRVVPSLAGELRAASARWTEAREEAVT
jgi:GTP-binding protein HflX